MTVSTVDVVNVVNFTPVLRDQLRAAYNEAHKTLSPNEVFSFRGKEYVMSYAQYLLEFLDKTLGPTPVRDNPDRALRVAELISKEINKGNIEGHQNLTLLPDYRYEDVIDLMITAEELQEILTFYSENKKTG